MAAQSLGYRVAVLDPDADSPAGRIADRHLHADYLDGEALADLAELARAATTEFENVPAAALDFLARTVRVSPAAASGGSRTRRTTPDAEGCAAGARWRPLGAARLPPEGEQFALGTARRAHRFTSP
jgi:hypothetical protein